MPSTNEMVSSPMPSDSKYEILDNIEAYVNSADHMVVSLVICTTGFIANLFNLVVLTRPAMRTPTNLILGSVAAADIFTILLYIPKIIGANNEQIDKSLAFVYYKLVGGNYMPHI